MECQPKNDYISLEQQVELVQQGDHEIQNYLLKIYQPFIAKNVSQVCKRYISPTRDDEFSVGLSAFNEAMNSYSFDRGSSFLSFASLVIKRKVIDYIRKESNKYATLSLDESNDEEQMENPTQIKAATNLYQYENDQWHRKAEIVQLSNQLKEYKISFEELTIISPKHNDARASAIKVARVLYDDEQLRDYVIKKKKVPIKLLVNLVNVSKKTLERNRKYILVIFIILSGDYVYLKDYLKGVGM
ncbi:RNA polymerase sigma-I factor [Aquibacillus rhizosphaerae]|uniref:RNA polymerase sigma factor SigI n=1 Tax=Aquibacillus rhizosphaerae TaxID=3051431 RepID=A0ABT7L5F0_9BACI|nr:RNA polymerase sigma-I factor [Aquibacillus sp. LR5S19]MDL4840425.1 RNA polymerase sigma-I factor [Aquibacillus sp. LR5S19]